MEDICIITSSFSLFKLKKGTWNWSWIYMIKLSSPLSYSLFIFIYIYIFFYRLVYIFHFIIEWGLETKGKNGASSICLISLSGGKLALGLRFTFHRQKGKCCCQSFVIREAKYHSVSLLIMLGSTVFLFWVGRVGGLCFPIYIISTTLWGGEKLWLLTINSVSEKVYMKMMLF